MTSQRRKQNWSRGPPKAPLPTLNLDLSIIFSKCLRLYLRNVVKGSRTLLGPELVKTDSEVTGDRTADLARVAGTALL